MLSILNKLVVSFAVASTMFLGTLAFFRDACAVCEYHCCCQLTPTVTDYRCSDEYQSFCAGHVAYGCGCGYWDEGVWVPQACPPCP